MKKFNQITAWASIIFIGGVTMSWILHGMVSFLSIILNQPVKAVGYIILGSVLIYGLSKIKDL